jgi:hypothetical protein
MVTEMNGKAADSNEYSDKKWEPISRHCWLIAASCGSSSCSSSKRSKKRDRRLRWRCEKVSQDRLQGRADSLLRYGQSVTVDLAHLFNVWRWHG